MGTMGRPPKPTALRILQGNPGKRPLPKNEPRPKAGMPERPGWLLPEAKREWAKLAPQLVAVGVLTVVDRVPFAMFCQEWGRYTRAQKRMDTMEAAGEGESLAYRRVIMIASKHFQQAMTIAGRFGLTASDRSRISVPEQKQGDPFADFLSRSNAVGE